MTFPLSHPAIVHVPLGLAVVMPLVAAALTLAVWRGRLPRSAFAVLAALQLLVAGAGLVAMRLGDQAARQAKQLAPEAAVEAHEEAAETFVWTAVAVLVVAAGTLVVPARFVPATGALATAGALAAAVLAVSAGAKGGELVFRYGAGVKVVVPAGASAAAGEHVDDD